MRKIIDNLKAFLIISKSLNKREKKSLLFFIFSIFFFVFISVFEKIKFFIHSLRQYNPKKRKIIKRYKNKAIVLEAYGKCKCFTVFDVIDKDSLDYCFDELISGEASLTASGARFFEEYYGDKWMLNYLKKDCAYEFGKKTKKEISQWWEAIKKNALFDKLIDK